MEIWQSLQKVARTQHFSRMCVEQLDNLRIKYYTQSGQTLSRGPSFAHYDSPVTSSHDRCLHEAFFKNSDPTVFQFHQLSP